MEIEKSDLIETKLPVCTLEYDQKNDIIYAGAYCLDDGETSKRHGQLTSYELDENGKMHELEIIETGAILDMKIESDKLFVVDDQERFLDSFGFSRLLKLSPMKIRL